MSVPLRATAGMEEQREKKMTPGRKGPCGLGRKGPCGLLRRDYGVLGEKKICGHSGGNDRQGQLEGERIGEKTQEENKWSGECEVVQMRLREGLDHAGNRKVHCPFGPVRLLDSLSAGRLFTVC